MKLGSICYACIVMIVNIKLLTSTHSHSIISLSLILLSILMYYLVLFCMSLYYRFENFNDIYINFQSTDYFLTVFIIVACSILLDIGLGKIYIYFGIIKPVKLEKVLREEESKEQREKQLKTEMIGKIFEEKKYLPCKIKIK